MSEDDALTYINDYEVIEWCQSRKEIDLFVCSTCGLICSNMIDHDSCMLQDWWHLTARCWK